MVAKKVTVLSRSFAPDEPGWQWTSEGMGGYEIAPASDLPRGTKITLELKDDAKEFAQEGTVERIIQRYSSFVPFPIELNGKRLNTVQAIWARNKNEIKEEEYNDFTRSSATTTTSRCCACIFPPTRRWPSKRCCSCPQQNFETLGMGRIDSEVNLYCRKVLIQAKAKGLVPGLAALSQRRRGQRGFAAEHLPRDDAGHVADGEAEQSPDQPVPQIPR